MIKKLLQKNSHRSVLAVVLYCVLLISACNKKQPQNPVAVPAQPPTKAAAAVAPPKPVLAVASSASRLRTPPVNQFDFSNKKDPFKPFVAAKPEQSKSPESQRINLRNSLPIHSFDVSQFKLIGIITSVREKDNQAMVTDPGGKGYVLKLGMLIGKNDGKVTAINSKGVEVTEKYDDDNGKPRVRKEMILLPRKN